MHYLPLQTTSSFVFTIKNSVLSITQARALGVIPNVTTPSCFSSPSLSLPHLPISLSSDLKSILGFNSFCTQLLFSTQPSLHPIHSLQHTRLILVKERPEMLKFIWTKYTLQDPFQSGSKAPLSISGPTYCPSQAPAAGKNQLSHRHTTLFGTFTAPFSLVSLLKEFCCPTPILSCLVPSNSLFQAQTLPYSLGVSHLCGLRYP